MPGAVWICTLVYGVALIAWTVAYLRRRDSRQREGARRDLAKFEDENATRRERVIEQKRSTQSQISEEDKAALEILQSLRRIAGNQQDSADIDGRKKSIATGEDEALLQRAQGMRRLEKEV
jgi:hypothetical protein